MANTSIFAAFERMWQHIASALGNKANRDEVPTKADDISAVSYTAQTLTEVEQEQVRKNIGADGFATETYVDAKIAEAELGGGETDLSAYYTKDQTYNRTEIDNKIPKKTSDLTNDSGFITSYTETDPTVPAWAKAATKPTYTASEVGAVSNQDVKVGNNNWEQGDNAQGPDGKFLQAADLSLKNGVYDGSPYHSVHGTEFKAGSNFIYRDETTYSAGGSIEGGSKQFKAGDLLNVTSNYDGGGDWSEVTMTVGNQSITESQLGSLKGLIDKVDVDENGFETNQIIVQTLIINGKTIDELIQEKVEEIVLGGEW